MAKTKKPYTIGEIPYHDLGNENNGNIAWQEMRR
jgi:hypothetical protein